MIGLAIDGVLSQLLYADDVVLISVNIKRLMNGWRFLRGMDLKLFI